MRKKAKKIYAIVFAILFASRVFWGDFQTAFAEDADGILEPAPIDNPDLNEDPDLGGSTTPDDGTKYVDKVADFFVVAGEQFYTIDEEVSGNDSTQNGDDRYFKSYILGTDENIEDAVKKPLTDQVSANDISCRLPEEVAKNRSITEPVGVSRDINDPKVDVIEKFFDKKDLDRIYSFRTIDGVVYYALGTDIDWYVFKDGYDYTWHVDGLIRQGSVIIPDGDSYQFAGVESRYEYDGTSKQGVVQTLIDSVVSTANESVPNSFEVTRVEWNDSVNVGKYVATVHAKYVYNIVGGAKYYSKEFTVDFPYEITPKTVVVSANSYSKNVGDVDPAFGGSIDGSVSQDPVTADFWRIAGNEAVGSYDIFITTHASSNYVVVENYGKLTINAVNNPPSDNPPEDNPPSDNPPSDNPPSDNPPSDNPPENNPIVVEEVIEEEPVIEEVIEEPEPEVEIMEEPVALIDEPEVEIPETPIPLDEGHGCWIHWLIMILTVVDLVYTIIQAIRNKKKLDELNSKKEEK